jgi:glycine/D-amino acid oxidase-like deaminating enzyme
LYPQLGGGIIGSTTAYYLTRHPKFDPTLHTITLLEATAIAAGASGKAGGLLALWAYPDCIVPLSYRLHAELAEKHEGTKRWGYRRLKCGSFDARVTKARLETLQRAKPASISTEILDAPIKAGGNGETKDWEKLPKQNGTAESMLTESSLPPDLDWIDAVSVGTYQEMGVPGATETAQVHPYLFTTSIAALAQESGVEIRTNAKVTKINSSKVGVESVEYEDRQTQTSHTIGQVTDVVVAAGPWTGGLLPRSRVEGLRAHSVVFNADVSAYAVFTDIELPGDFIPEHRAKVGQKRKHKGRVDPEVYARPDGEVYACGRL